ncbi:actin cytoskeleton-regulatory complex protein End3p [[Candida] railenensis]|uniref:Actin cytoskeleton-regulatory complex protein END3 n=1 Tax=[Candida] railenensis TaxID=45579 RepID=A0A9P0QPM9_9ASCO|nr:actin cytoskeleton-regulatory complex protein End3p [[Candida] railenensis]
MPRLEDWEIKKYWEIFQGLSPENGKLTGERVSPVLKNSRLSDQQLSKIWELSDIDADGKLDFEEFCITMRLIFDLVNGSGTLPEELPSWLIPASKAHLIQANQAVASGNNNYKQQQSPNGGSGSSDDFDEDESLSDEFDWYISPTDKATYESIYNSNSDTYGRVRFESLNGLYGTLQRVPRSDISSAWNLVNPKSFETIDKDQVLVFLHILNQRENGKRVPRGVPASLRATFSKEQPTYDLNQINPTSTLSASANDKKTFGTSYLSKIGMNSNAVAGNNSNGTDFSSTKDKDWEEVRLKRELTNLEDLLAKAQSTAKEDGQDNESVLIKHELTQLLKYKEEKLSKATSSNGHQADLSDVKTDIDEIELQVTTLEGYLDEKKKELANLQQQLAA